MKIKYIFVDGTVSEVEVDEEYGRLHIEADRKLENENRRWRYHVKTSLDNCDYEGEWFQDMNPNPHEQMLLIRYQTLLVVQLKASQMSLSIL